MGRGRIVSKHTISDTDDDELDNDWEESKPAKKKRIRLKLPGVPSNKATTTEDDAFSMQSLLDVVSQQDSDRRANGPMKRAKTQNQAEKGAFEGVDFEKLLEPELEELKDVRRKRRLESAESATGGGRHRPLSTMELNYIAQTLRERNNTEELSSYERLLMKRIELNKLRSLGSMHKPSLTFPPSPPSPSDSDSSSSTSASQITALHPPPALPPPPSSVLSALNSIGTTPHSSSLLSRIAGPAQDDYPEEEYLMRDWKGAGRALWRELMEDVRGWYGIMYPERDQEERHPASIDYVILQSEHLPQVHDLLGRIFWPGIDVSDCLHNSPSKCTVVALYRRLVVGAAFMSSPEETYITYLAVRPGWEGAGIATRMLYSLLSRNSSRDVILHVSANNPAMLLYNRFGFKAEEFIVGFYEQYLDRDSRQSKNAFRLRLRR